jgi:DNA repair photolyase
MITRGPMIVRDIDVLQRASAAAEVTVNISIPTLDAAIWRTTEPGTAHPRQRLRALRLLADAGIRAGVGMAPILPGLSDDPRRLREVVLAAREAGASFLWWNVLNLRPGTRAFPAASRPRLAGGGGALPALVRRSGLPAQGRNTAAGRHHGRAAQRVGVGAPPQATTAHAGARPAEAAARRLTS